MSFFKNKKSMKKDSELLIYANISNDLLITNSMLKEKIFQHEDLINYIKEIFLLIDKKIPESENYSLKGFITNKLKSKSQVFKNSNLNLKKEIKNLNHTLNKRLEAQNDALYVLNKNLDRLKEDNFILENTLILKNSYIKKFKNQLKDLKNNKNENIELYLLYGKKLNVEHEKQLEKVTNELAKILKEQNQELLNNIQREKEYQSLQKECIQSKRLQTENISLNYFKNNEEENYLNLSLLFDDFEKEEDEYSDSLNFSQDETYINYDLDFNMQNLNLSQSNEMITNVNDINFPYYTKKERLFTSDHNEPDAGIPKLNLKQIEFNKVRIITEGFENLSDESDSIDNQLSRIKKDIERQNKKKERLKKIISNFKTYYKKMKLYIEQLSLSLKKKERSNSIL
jgi:hypothetical protein